MKNLSSLPSFPEFDQEYHSFLEKSITLLSFCLFRSRLATLFILITSSLLFILEIDFFDLLLAAGCLVVQGFAKKFWNLIRLRRWFFVDFSELLLHFSSPNFYEFDGD